MTLMPGEESSHARGHRLPYVASEILATDNGTLIDKFFKSASAAQKPKEASDSDEGNDGQMIEIDTKKKEEDSSNESYELVTRLFQFVTQKAPLNSVLAGYFNKLLTRMMQNTKKPLCKFIFEVDGGANLLKMADHAYQPSIAEILVKIAVIDETSFEANTQA